MEQGGSKPSTETIMVARVLIRGGYQLGRGLSKRLEGIVELVAIQENPGKVGLDYHGTNVEGKPIWRTQSQGQPKIRPDLHQHFISGGTILPKQVAMIGEQPSNQQEWVHFTEKEPANWTIEALPNLFFQKIINKEPPTQIDNTILENPKFQSLVEDLEVINLGSKDEKKEVSVGKHMPPDLRQSLIELLKEYADVFAWSYRDMPGLDRKIVEYKLPLLPNSVLV
ncbi:hypothetical protein CR513_06521, partial [Mucuna pruriens]